MPAPFIMDGLPKMALTDRRGRIAIAHVEARQNPLDPMAANAYVNLPAGRTREGAATVVGYEPFPARAHLDQVSAMLSDVSERITMSGDPDAERLRVRLTMSTLPLGMPMQLFYYPLTDIDADGDPVSPLPNEEISAVFIANQPVPLIREVALHFLLDLIGRSAPVREVIEGRQRIDELPDRVAETEAETGLIAWETLSYDWTRAADVVRERAAAQGFVLDVRHTPDLFDTREEIVRRLPALRRLYREEERVRLWVDHSIAGLAGGRFELRGGGERARLFVQQQAVTAGLSQFVAQALRDSYVCGNGYFRPEMAGLDMGARCLRPEAVEVGPGNRLIEHRPDGKELPLGPETMHFRGVEQLRSSYGSSALEPLLFALQHRAVVANSRHLHDAAPPHMRQMLDDRFGNALKTAQAMEQWLEDRLKELTGVIELVPREIPDDLYLPGQETL